MPYLKIPRCKQICWLVRLSHGEILIPFHPRFRISVIFWEMLSWTWHWCLIYDVIKVKGSQIFCLKMWTWIITQSDRLTKMSSEEGGSHMYGAQTKTYMHAPTHRCSSFRTCVNWWQAWRGSYGVMMPWSHVSLLLLFSQKRQFSERKLGHSSPISSSITRSIYYCRLLLLASCDAVIISKYINVKLYNAFTALILKALHIIEMVCADCWVSC